MSASDLVILVLEENPEELPGQHSIQEIYIHSFSSHCV